MKKIYTLFLVLIIAGSLVAQTPQSFKYQAVARDVSGNVIADQPVGMQMSILQGSTSGIAVYVETFTPTTTGFGLINLNIGEGTVVSGDFTTIDWSADTYFVKVEMDITGGTTYAEYGTSQLLSVPYALHAKTAESITGTHYVGELYGGGVVFWVDQTGNHGLICSMIDLSTSQVWSNIDATEIGVTAKSDWDGNSNSTAITGQAGHTSSAAKLCKDYTNVDYGTGTYPDWYLPSRGELNDLWNSLKAVQKALDSDGNPVTTAIIKSNYWSSSEYSNSLAWTFFFNLGRMSNNYKYYTYYVRAVRAF